MAFSLENPSFEAWYEGVTSQCVKRLSGAGERGRPQTLVTSEEGRPVAIYGVSSVSEGSGSFLLADSDRQGAVAWRGWHGRQAWHLRQAESLA